MSTPNILAALKRCVVAWPKPLQEENIHAFLDWFCNSNLQQVQQLSHLSQIPSLTRWFQGQADLPRRLLPWLMEVQAYSL